MDFLEKQAAIVRSILHKTKSGELKWTASKSHENVFETRLGQRTVSIGYEHYPDEDGDIIADSVLTIMSESGEVARKIRDTTLSNVPVKYDGYSGWFSLMEDLYESAGLHASGAHEALDDIIKLLGITD